MHLWNRDEFSIQIFVCKPYGELLQKYQPKGPGSAQLSLGTQSCHYHTSRLLGEQIACAEEGLNGRNRITKGQRE